MKPKFLSHAIIIYFFSNIEKCSTKAFFLEITNSNDKTTTGYDHQVWLGIRKGVNGSNDTTWRLMDHSEATFLAWGSDEPGEPGISKIKLLISNY